MWRLSVQPSKDSALAPVDVLVDAEADGSVADLAAGLGAHLGGDNSRLLLAPSTEGRHWPASRRLADLPLHDGDVLTVSSVTQDWLARPPAPGARARAVAQVLTGPDSGRRIPLTGDVITIGRAASAGIRLGDPLVSREHAQILLSATPVLRDLGSAHGTRVADREISTPVALEWGERITVGDTVLVLSEGESPRRERGVLRPPRFGEDVAEAEVDVPTPPNKPRKTPLPWPMMLMPALMGGMMFMWTRSPMSLVFMIGFPVMLWVNHIVQRRQALREHAEEVALWRADLAGVLERLDAAASTQRANAEDDEPDLDDLRDRASARDHRLWNRHDGDPDFLILRAGRGPQPAIVRGKVSAGGDRLLRAEAQELLTARATLTGMPVPVSLDELTTVAVTGPAERVDAWVRAFLVRLAVTHSPVDVTVAAALGAQRADMETWLRWLPHAGPRNGGGPSVAVGAQESQALLQDLATADGGVGHTLFVVDAACGIQRRHIEQLAAVAADPERRLRILWLGDRLADVPASAGAAVDLADPAVKVAGRGGVSPLTSIDELDLAAAWRIARALNGYEDDSATVAADSRVPQQVRLPGLAPDLADADDAEAVLARWIAARGLRAQLGAGAEGVVTIDLREDGPHGLVAGTTGAGKSELLQSLVASLALNNPPSRITFLLVDYKGGAAFRECADLPHTVGYITDLTPALVQRALVSLHAELASRERLFAEYGVKDLQAMEAAHPEAAPPAMLICVDEFAALLAEVPDFVDGMVSIAQRGRSLGMHMLLATQRPAGVVTPQIKANTDLRIALRVASPDDSSDVIDAPDAAHLSRRTPGRAWLRRTGHGTRELVQVAWVGAHEPAAEHRERVRVRPFTARQLPEERTGPGAVSENPLTDLERIVVTTTTAFERSGVPAPKRPWLPAMPEVIEYGITGPGTVELRDGTEDAAGAPAGSASRAALAESVLRPGQAVLGLLDRPALQEQVPWVVDYADGGHLLVFGASGSGKSELLRTLAASVTASDEPAPVSIYGLDAGGGGLSLLERLPSVGSVVTVQQPERVMRLVRMLHRTVEHRNSLLAAHGVSDIGALAAVGEPIRRIHLLIDNMPALMESFEGGGSHRRQHAEQLVTILQEGRRCGVHVTATAPQRTGLSSQLQAAFGQRVVLRMTVADDYAMLGVPGDVLDADSVAGRGLVGSDEVQIATIGAAGEPAQAQLVSDLAEAFAQRYAEEPEVGVPAMPFRLPQYLLPAPARDEVTLAVEENFVSGVGLELLSGPLLVTGRSKSGRTGILLGLAQLVARSAQPPAQIVLAGPRAGRPVLTPAGEVAPEDVPGLLLLPDPQSVLDWLDSDADGPVGAADAEASKEQGSPWRLVLVDDAHEWERAWEAGGAERRVLEALRSVADATTALVVATDPDEARSRQHIPGLVDAVRRSRRAVLLAPEMGDGALVSAQVPMSTHEPLTGPGRGLLVTGSARHVVHVLSPSTAEENS